MGQKNAQFNMVDLFCMLVTLKLCLGQNSTKPNICIWGFTGIVVRCFPPHLNLTRQVVLLCFTLLPCLTTFNIVGYINKIELNNLNVVFRQYAAELHIELHLICRVVCHFAMPCFIKLDMHYTWLCIMPCSCVGCLLCCVLLSGVASSGWFR